MKKILGVYLTLMCILSFPFVAQAHQVKEIEFTQEKTVYVNSEEEFLNYPREKYTKYTFIIRPKTRATTQCSYCGAVATYYMMEEQVGLYLRGCPYVTVHASDEVSTYARYRYEECSTCGRTRKAFVDNRYVIHCTGHGVYYNASYYTTIEKGYDIHEDMNYWD